MTFEKKIPIREKRQWVGLTCVFVCKNVTRFAKYGRAKVNPLVRPDLDSPEDRR